jgi:hypothetical protein
MFVVSFENGTFPTFKLEEISLTRAIIGSDPFLDYLWQTMSRGVKQSSNESVSIRAISEAVRLGTTVIDLPLPLLDMFALLHRKFSGHILGLGAIQEFKVIKTRLGGKPLEYYADRIKATIKEAYSQDVSCTMKTLENGILTDLLLPSHKINSLTQQDIDAIELDLSGYKQRLRKYRGITEIIQFGGKLADWLIGIRRIDLLISLCDMIRKEGYKPLLACHFASMVVHECEKTKLDVAGYIIPLNKLWSLWTLEDTLGVIRLVDRPIIAMKPLAYGQLANNLEEAFKFLYEDARVEATMPGVASEHEAIKTFSAAKKVLDSMKIDHRFS